MAKQIIDVGDFPNDKTGTPFRDCMIITNENFDEIYPITESITKTVAADGMPAGIQDFDSFDDAVQWLATIKTLNGAFVTILLEDGQHIIDDKYQDYAELLTVSNASITIDSASSDKSLCTITLATGSTNTQLWFIKFERCTLFVNNITLNPRANGNSTVIPYIFFTVYTFTYGFCGDCDVLNSYRAFGAIDKSTMVFKNTTITNPNIGMYGIRGSYVQLEGTNIIDGATKAGVQIEGSSTLAQWTGSTVEIKNSVEGIRVFNDSHISFVGLTLTTNTSNSNVPINEVQDDGSYIVDGISGLFHKGTLTADTVKTVGTGKDFETLDEALRWSTDLVYNGNELTLLLDDGTHYLYITGTFEYNYENANIVIESASADKTLCILTLRSDSIAGYKYPFVFYRSTASFKNITIDCSLGGAPDGANTLFSYSRELSVLFIQGVIAKNMYMAFGIYNNSYGNINGTTDFDNISSIALDVRRGSLLYIQEDVTINNCKYGLYAWHSATIEFTDTKTLTITNSITSAIKARGNSSVSILGTNVLTGNVEDYFSPLNEIQYDGSFISDGSELFHKGDEIITSDIDITVGGTDYPTIMDAFDWYATVRVMASSRVRILLPDGLHLITGINDINAGNYYKSLVQINGSYLTLESINGVKENCTIAIASGEVSADYIYIFEVCSGTFHIANITFDWAADGYTLWNNIAAVVNEPGGTISISSADFNNVRYGIEMRGGSLNCYNGSFNNTISGAVYASAGSEQIKMWGSLSMTNSLRGIRAGISDVKVQVPSVVDVTGTTTPYPWPLNEIQENGSYISDGTESLFHKNTITKDVTKLVKSEGGTPGLDFDSLEDALTWLALQKTINGAKVTLALEDGYHLALDIHEDDALRHKITCSTIIKSVSGFPTACTITTELNSTVTDISLWDFLDCPYIEFTQFTIDPRANGNSTILPYGMHIEGSPNGYMFMQGCLIKNLYYGVSLPRNGIFRVYDSTFTNCYYGILNTGGGKALLDGSITIDGSVYGLYAKNVGVFSNDGALTIKNCTTEGVYLKGGATLITTITDSLTFIANVSDALFPINEIQYDGSLIADGNSALSFKA